MTGYILVWGQKVDLWDAMHGYVCAKCGADFDAHGDFALRCRGPEHHIVEDHTGITNRPSNPKPKKKPKPEGRLTVGSGTRPYSVIAKEFKCARCGAPLSAKEDKLRCIGPQHHLITTGEDVEPIRTWADWEWIDALRFAEGYTFWNEGEGTMRLKDRKTISHGLKRAGKIRLGYFAQLRDDQGNPKVYKSGKKKGQPIKAPVNVDYFALHDAPAVAEAYAEHPSVISDHYGSGPTELLVFVPFDDVERVFSARYEWRKGAFLHCAGDGEFIQYALSADGLHTVIRDGFATTCYSDREWTLDKGAQVACSGAHIKGEGFWNRCADCTAAEGEAAMTLRVLVRDPQNPMVVVAGEMAYYEIHTKSSVTYDLLVEQLDKLAAEAARAGGKITGIPLRLSRVPTKMSYVQKNRDGSPVKRATSEHALMNIEPDPEWVRAMTAFAYRQAVMLEAPSPAPIHHALPAGNGNGNGNGGDDAGPDDSEPEGEQVVDDNIVEGDFQPSDAEAAQEPPAEPPRATGKPAANGKPAPDAGGDPTDYWRSRGSVTLKVKQQSDMAPAEIWALAVQKEAAGEIDRAWSDAQIIDALLGLAPPASQGETAQAGLPGMEPPPKTHYEYDR